MTITVKTVKRYSFGGKTYHSLNAAYKASAIKELKAIILRLAFQIEREKGYPPTDENYIYSAYARMFPHPEDGSCGRVYSGGCSLSTMGFGCPDVPFYSWCRVAKRKWIETKIAELKTTVKVVIK